MNKKRKPNIDENSYYTCSVYVPSLNQTIYPVIPTGSYNITKDNTQYGASWRSCSSNRHYIRVPKLSAPIKTWKNFYRLFPWVYVNMLEEYRKCAFPQSTIHASISFYGLPDEKRNLKVILDLKLKCFQYAFWKRTGYQYIKESDLTSENTYDVDLCQQILKPLEVEE